MGDPLPFLQGKEIECQEKQEKDRGFSKAMQGLRRKSKARERGEWKTKARKG